uniref:Uncharacterized protein n=1 Tax=Anguilla anguilla TaxID=7936 RepID=A0A0E9UYM8_ANGAN
MFHAGLQFKNCKNSFCIPFDIRCYNCSHKVKEYCQTWETNNA